MKINVIHRRIFGNERFYPSDDFTNKFLSVFRVNKQRQTTFTERQLRELKQLGFDIIIHPEYSL